MFSKVSRYIVLLIGAFIFTSAIANDKYPVDWDWANEAAPEKLADHAKAPADIGIYEIGYLKDGKFEPMYVGRAVGVTLKARLSKHFKSSHNSNIKENAGKLHYRTKVFKSKKVASYVEAITITAFEYPWNKRNEWKKHWELEN